jgi:hypothetical protein
MTETEPYHITAVKHLAAHYSADHFRHAVQQCRDVIAKVIAEDKRSDQQIARVCILRYLDRLLIRASQWTEDDADLMALVVRNQLELRFWADFISESPENATTFLKEADIDARELHEKMQKAAPGEVPDLPEAIEGKRVFVKRAHEREELMHKLCSKLIHPTALALTNPRHTVSNENYRTYFAIEAVRYGWGILSMLHDIKWEE